MKATLRLMIAAAVLVSAQMSFATTDSGSVKIPCPYAKKSGGLANTDATYGPVAKPVVAKGSTSSAS